MGSLIDELQRREAAARAEAEELRGRIAELAERLARAEERLSRLVITRETVEEVLDSAATEIAPVSSAAEQLEGTALPRPGRPPVTGVVAVPPWRAGLEVSVLPQDYRDLLEVAEDAGRPLRAGQIAAAAGLSTDRGKVETLRSKLKRLAERGWLAEEAGLFALPARNGNGAGEAVKPG
jgi:cell division septum initiation protein DivIVA